MSDAIWGYGTLLQIGDGGGGWTTVAEVLDMNLPPLNRDQADVTNQDSPNGYEEFIMTIKRTGEVSFKINFLGVTEPTHDATTGLWSLYDSGVLTPFRIVMPQSYGTVGFNAYVKGLSGAIPMNAQITADITIKVSGAVTLT